MDSVTIMQNALNQYNRCYNNARYREISDDFAAFLEIRPDYTMITEIEEQIHHDFMNALIDACLFICGFERYGLARNVVMDAAVNVGPEFAALVFRYLKSFGE